MGWICCLGVGPSKPTAFPKLFKMRTNIDTSNKPRRTPVWFLPIAVSFRKDYTLCCHHFPCFLSGSFLGCAVAEWVWQDEEKKTVFLAREQQRVKICKESPLIKIALFQSQRWDHFHLKRMADLTTSIFVSQIHCLFGDWFIPLCIHSTGINLSSLAAMVLSSMGSQCGSLLL